MFYKPSSKIVSLVFSVLVLCFAIGFYIFAQWQEPPQPPPGGNIPAPLNVGPVGQAKIGGLIINTGGAPVGFIVDDDGDSIKGRVGIGTTNPTEKLDVAGDIRVRNIPDCDTVDTDTEGKLICGEDELGLCLTGTGECPEGEIIKGITVSESCVVTPICVDTELPSPQCPPGFDCGDSNNCPPDQRAQQIETPEECCTNDQVCMKCVPYGGDCNVCVYDPEPACVPCSQVDGCNPSSHCPPNPGIAPEDLLQFAFDYCTSDEQCEQPPGEEPWEWRPPGGPSGGGGVIASGSGSCTTPYDPTMSYHNNVCGPGIDDFFTACQQAPAWNTVEADIEDTCDGGYKGVPCLIDDCPIHCRWYMLPDLAVPGSGGFLTEFEVSGVDCLNPPPECIANRNRCIRGLTQIDNQGLGGIFGNVYCNAWTCTGEGLKGCTFGPDTLGVFRIRDWSFCKDPEDVYEGSTVAHSPACSPARNRADGISTLPDWPPCCCDKWRAPRWK